MSKLRAWLRHPTTAWRLGVLMPITMVLVDPAVFKGNFIGQGAILGSVRAGCYCAILLGMVALGYHLLAARRSAWVAGALTAATVFATGLGLVLLPASTLGAFWFGIGLLGLSPFFTALVIGNQARCAFRESVSEKRWVHFVLGALLYAGVCGLVQVLGGSAIASIAIGGEGEEWRPDNCAVF
jgi:hypothetical protein